MKTKVRNKMRKKGMIIHNMDKQATTLIGVGGVVVVVRWDGRVDTKIARLSS